jgi:hypothetical protein
VPKPKVQTPVGGGDELGGRSPGRRRRDGGGGGGDDDDDDNGDGFDDDEHMQAQSRIEQLLILRENYASEIEAMKRECVVAVHVVAAAVVDVVVVVVGGGGVASPSLLLHGASFRCGLAQSIESAPCSLQPAWLLRSRAASSLPVVSRYTA